MSYQVPAKSCTSRLSGAVSALAAAAVCGFILSAPARAQTPAPAPAAPAPAAKEAPKPAAPAAAAKPAAPAAAAPAAAAKPAAPAAGAATAAAPAAGGEGQSSWVKLCDKVASASKDKDGKETKTEKNVCATFHDTIDANSGMTVVSAAVREVEGDPKPDIQVTVPLGMIIPAGARVSVLSAEQAEKLKKGEEIDAKAVKQVDLKFTACLPNGCTAEVQAPDDILALMKTSSALLVRSVYVNGQPFAVPVPLAGFDKTLAGKPIDNAVYKKARVEMMTAINTRRAEKAKEAALKDVPPPPGFKEGQPVTAEKLPGGAAAAKP
jgi:invasion protein IalB